MKKIGNQTAEMSMHQSSGSSPNNESQMISDRDKQVEEGSTQEVQDDSQKDEAPKFTWSKRSLIAAYSGIFLFNFIGLLKQVTTGNLNPYVYSAFKLHSLVATAGILTSVIGGVFFLPISKIIDVWGRTEGYLLMIACCTIGLILKAACNNIETYVAAQMIHAIGHEGMAYVLSVFIADTSSLRNRSLILGFQSLPYVATSFAGPALAQAFYNHVGWRWAFGAFGIIIPATSLPLCAIFIVNQRLIEKNGVAKSKPSGRSWVRSILYYSAEFDVIGGLIVCAGLVLFLLPFSIVTYVHGEWRSPMVISMITIGGSLLALFPVYERFWATKCFIPFELLKNRTVLASCIAATVGVMSGSCWDGYFTSSLQVINGLSIAQAGYVSHIPATVACFWSILVGWLIRHTNRYKWLAIWATPLQVLGVGLLIHFRQPDIKLAYIIMCQVFISISGVTLVACYQIAAMAATDHQHVAVIIALLSVSASVGAAIGSSICGAIWTNTIPKYLTMALPESLKEQAPQLYASLDTQLSYPFGTPQRDALIYAYGVAQRRMCIAATVIILIDIVAVLAMRDVRLDTKKQEAEGVV